jgi:hypothetical protein
MNAILLAHVKGDKSRLARQVRAYDSIFKRPRPFAKQWILDLKADGSKPYSWPSTMRWSRYKAKWLAMYWHCQDWLLLTPKHPCPKATRYGGRTDDGGKFANDHVNTHKWKREWCGRPAGHWAQAYYSYRPRTLPAVVAQ